MDDDRRQLIIQLCTQVGMRMEDASAPAVMCAHADAEQLQTIVADLLVAAYEISAIVAAAAVLANVSATDRKR